MEPRELDADLLRQDLVTLWREMGSEHESEGGVTRACLSTLAISGAPGGRTEALVADLIAVHPSRIILVGDDSAQGPGNVKAWVGASCSRRSGGTSYVCSETVNMLAGSDTDAKVASAIRSLSVGGLPVHVLSVTRSPLAVGWIPRLDGLANAVLGDSTWLSREDMVAFWKRCVSREGGSYLDMSWESLGDWRRALTLWFDRPGESMTLNQIDRVTLKVASGSGGWSKAWLFLGWLGSRLGWEPGTGTSSHDCRTPGGRVEIEIRETAARDDPALIHSVEIGFRDSRPSLTWRRVSLERAIVVEAGDERTPLFRLNQTKTSPADAMGTLFRRNRIEPVTRAAMGAAAKMAERAGE